MDTIIRTKEKKFNLDLFTQHSIIEIKNIILVQGSQAASGLLNEKCLYIKNKLGENEAKSFRLNILRELL